MKNWIITASAAAFMLMFTVAGTAQNVPQKVKDAFSDKYSNATHMEWDDDDNGEEYEVDFTLNGEHLEASFATDGTWKYTQKEITHEELPQAVKSILKDEYADFKIDDINMLETPEGVRYKVEADSDNDDRVLLFSGDGTKLKDVTENDDDDDWWFD